MFIQTEITPNPATLKFIPGREVMNSGSIDIRKGSDNAAGSPLAQRLFKIDGVEGVFLGSDFISVTKDEAHEWLSLKPMIMGALFEHFTTGQPVYTATVAKPQNAEPDSDIVVQIKALLDERVRPAVARDGGDIEFEAFEKGILFLRMQGACAGCPSSTYTLKAGIENMMRHYVPEVLEVRAVQD